VYRDGLRTQGGLLDEVRELSGLQESLDKASSDTVPSSPPNFTQGVSQSIGKLKWITVVERSFDLRQASENFMNILLTHHRLR
jgi:hypothetical protein